MFVRLGRRFVDVFVTRFIGLTRPSASLLVRGETEDDQVIFDAGYC